MILNAQFTVHPDAESARKGLRKFGNIHIAVVLERWVKSMVNDATMKYGGPRWCFLESNTEERLELFQHGNNFITVEIARPERNVIRITCECFIEEAAMQVMKKILTSGNEHHIYGTIYGDPSIQQQVQEGALTIQRENTSEEVIKLLM